MNWAIAAIGDEPASLARLLASAAKEAANTSGSTPAWATALIGVGGLVVGALIAGGFRLVGDKAERRASAQRDALYALQEAGLKLRIALQNYGQAGARPDAETTEALDKATGKFDLLIERVTCETVRRSARDWLALAQRYWTSDPESSLSQEETFWRQLQQFVGEELRRLD